MGEIVYCEQRSEEWFRTRLGVITASAAHKMNYAVQRKTYLYQILSERLTGNYVPLAINEYMQWGMDYEDEARIWYEEQTGNTVEEVGFVFRDKDRRAGCSPDGLVGKYGLIEIKCPMSKTHILQINEGPKLEYRRQMQFQMWCTGRAWCDFVTYDPRMPEKIKGYIKRIPRDEKMMLKITEDVDKLVSDMNAFIEEHLSDEKE
jgi:putative phage-type endonuclease